ncbi:hypothetical protein K491DRAFT_681196 [Lophiostoma macrostomum CBS 122681]|uniref:F-box domain-containing protein n=1 Tax=Lophiostoma macrostomum CBS 122681 TaxID=1314788 RepID=A0A6A6SY73_9PLEO|nr:hypothetical protein K491DRAFT_681196 [Lophiostoma macrostomum CBS 122681]
MPNLKNGRMGFLSLPPEIRVIIYTLIADIVPYEERLSEYDGLRLSCRLVKHEMDSECIREFSKGFEKYFESCPPGDHILNRLNPIIITSLRHLTLGMSCEGWMPIWRRTRSLSPNPLHKVWSWITQLKIQTLNVELNLGNATYEEAGLLWWDFMDIFARPERAEDDAPRLVVDVVFPDQHSKDDWERFQSTGRCFLSFGRRKG